METDKMISVIIPVYNVEPYIKRCLDSVIGQTYESLEIILIDDGSPDNCGKICDEYARMDDRVTVVHKKNGGVGAARNTGIDMAQGKWITFVDPDDWLEVDCCKCVLQVADKTDCDLDNDEYGNTLRTFPPLASRMLSSENLREIQLNILASDVTLFGFQCATPWGKLYRRRFLMKYLCRFPVDIKKRQDVLFNLNCLEHIALYHDFDALYYVPCFCAGVWARRCRTCFCAALLGERVRAVWQHHHGTCNYHSVYVLCERDPHTVFDSE